MATGKKVEERILGEMEKKEILDERVRVLSVLGFWIG